MGRIDGDNEAIITIEKPTPEEIIFDEPEEWIENDPGDRASLPVLELRSGRYCREFIALGNVFFYGVIGIME